MSIIYLSIIMIFKSVNFFIVQFIFSSFLLLVQCSFILRMPKNGKVFLKATKGELNVDIGGPIIPSFVHLRYKENSQIHPFDGAVVAKNWIITIAALILPYENKELEVAIGISDNKLYEKERKIIKREVHSKYKTKPFKYNIALLKTEEEIKGKKIPQLPHRGHHVHHNSKVYLYGFGEKTYSKLTGIEMKTQKRKNFNPSTATLLISEVEGHQACIGDYGSPIYYQSTKGNEWQLVAITFKFNVDTCREFKYILATEITHPNIVKFVDTITNGSVHYGD